ncbi:MAG: alkaline phosphatase family protein [Desulfobacteraceae bacterium]|jgi:2,3-bisphosphoglycerate-independent phosphoglycerate mutase
MKIILVLLDGIGDRSYKILDHRTPLQAAVTPNLDRLAELGSNGLFHAALSGECLPSETAHYLMFGYDLKSFPGRGLLEAVGEGVDFEDNDVLCLAHLVGVNWEGHMPILTVKHDKIEGDAEALRDLYGALTPYKTHHIHFRLQQTRRNDAILVLSGKASPHISDSDPMVPGRPLAHIFPIPSKPEPEEAERTAMALNAYLSHCHRVLEDHELNRVRRERNLSFPNFLVTQRCGRRIFQDPFEEKWGLSGMLIGSVSIYGGLAYELGLEYVRVRDSEDPSEDLRERIGIALEDTSHDFVHVHTKVPDEAAHKGDPKGKVAAIASLDRGLDELVKAVENRDDLLVAITSDHSTPSESLLIHSGESSPLSLVGPNVRRDDVDTFDEVSVAKGCLGLIRGKELMLTILNYMDRSALKGHRLGKIERPYFPIAYEPFRLTD